MIKSIKKRDGRVVLYNEDKIAQAILKAMQASGEGDASDAAGVANSVEASKTLYESISRELQKKSKMNIRGMAFVQPLQD